MFFEKINIVVELCYITGCFSRFCKGKVGV